MSKIFFNSWESLIHILVVGVLGYLSLIFILRITGNRTLSKMNSFDFVITIALGSTYSSALLQKDVSLTDAVLAFFVLAGLQFLITFLSVRFRSIDRLVKGEPVVLYANGEFQRIKMKKAHVTEDEVISGVRQQGLSSISDADFVVLETNGKIVATSIVLSSNHKH